MHGPVLLLILLVSIVFIVYMTSRVKAHPFLVLLIAAIGVGFSSGLSTEEILQALKNGFGSTLTNIGIVIIAGTIIGVLLEKTGASVSLANQILKLAGKERSPLAMAFTGYLIGIPIFCDSGFVVLSPLNKALAKMSGTSMTVMALALGGPLYVVHCLVPPTPGPAAAAGILGADLGLTIIIGIFAGIPAVLVGMLWALKFASRYFVEADSDLSFEEIASAHGKLPSPWIAAAPIVIPVLLIGAGSFVRIENLQLAQRSWANIMVFLGDPNIALLAGVLLAILLVKNKKTDPIGSWINDAIRTAGPILAITGAGGAFGYLLRVTPIGDYLGSTLMTLNIGLFLPFILASALKTAQGSSTVSIITTSSLMLPVISQMGLDSTLGLVFVVLSMGAGSMVISHANDSYFWVVAKFSNLDAATAYKTHSPGTAILGFTAMLTIWLLSILLGIYSPGTA